MRHCFNEDVSVYQFEGSLSKGLTAAADKVREYEDEAAWFQIVTADSGDGPGNVLVTLYMHK